MFNNSMCRLLELLLFINQLCTIEVASTSLAKSGTHLTMVSKDRKVSIGVSALTCHKFEKFYMGCCYLSGYEEFIYHWKRQRIA